MKTVKRYNLFRKLCHIGAMILFVIMVLAMTALLVGTLFDLTR